MGRLTARRPVPVPPGPAGTPRQRLTTSREQHRTDRRAAPRPDAGAHERTQDSTAGAPGEP
ncbi:hypothetical protein [Streptomyces achromogenes]|uniref:hypothetical protein n=1 Tax=Streptomyces achromogenes TaxID=67255 RepID=UPI00367544B8